MKNIRIDWGAVIFTIVVILWFVLMYNVIFVDFYFDQY